MSELHDQQAWFNRGWNSAAKFYGPFGLVLMLAFFAGGHWLGHRSGVNERNGNLEAMVNQCEAERAQQEGHIAYEVAVAMRPKLHGRSGRLQV